MALHFRHISFIFTHTAFSYQVCFCVRASSANGASDPQAASGQCQSAVRRYSMRLIESGAKVNRRLGERLTTHELCRVLSFPRGLPFVARAGHITTMTMSTRAAFMLICIDLEVDPLASWSTSFVSALHMQRQRNERQKLVFGDVADTRLLLAVSRWVVSTWFRGPSPAQSRATKLKGRSLGTGYILIPKSWTSKQLSVYTQTRSKSRSCLLTFLAAPQE